MTDTKQSKTRNLVLRGDGKMINVFRRSGQLFVCAQGCCCGLTERGHDPVPEALFHTEWERRRLRNKVHLTIGGCLGPCALANVVMLLFNGREVWFHTITSDAQVLAIYDYIDAMVAADRYLPPPHALAPNVFSAFNWPVESSGFEVRGVERESSNLEPRTAFRASGFLFLTHADTDILALNQIAATLPADFPPVRAFNVARLGADADLASFLDRTAPESEVVIVRLHGGRCQFRRRVGATDASWQKRTISS